MDAVTGQLTAITTQVSQQVSTVAAPVTDKIVASPAYAAASAFYVSKQPYLEQITSDEWAAIVVTVLPGLFLVAHFLWSTLCCCSQPSAKIAPEPARQPLPKKGDKPPQPKGPPPRGAPPKASPPPKGKANPPPKGKNGKELTA